MSNRKLDPKLRNGVTEILFDNLINTVSGSMQLLGYDAGTRFTEAELIGNKLFLYYDVIELGVECPFTLSIAQMNSSLDMTNYPQGMQRLRGRVMYLGTGYVIYMTLPYEMPVIEAMDIVDLMHTKEGMKDGWIDTEKCANVINTLRHIVQVHMAQHDLKAFIKHGLDRGYLAGRWVNDRFEWGFIYLKSPEGDHIDIADYPVTSWAEYFEGDKSINGLPYEKPSLKKKAKAVVFPTTGRFEA
jgi:hypothetical protein